MKLKVEFNELQETSKEFNKDRDALEVERIRLLESLERMKNFWSGDDFDKFYSKAYEYVKRMEVLTAFMYNTSEFMKTSGSVYRDQDETFSKDLDKEVALNEQRVY